MTNAFNQIFFVLATAAGAAAFAAEPAPRVAPAPAQAPPPAPAPAQAPARPPAPSAPAAAAAPAAPAVAAAKPASDAPPTRSPPITVRLNWVTKNFPLPYKIYELYPRAVDMVQTNRNVRDAAKVLPIMRELKDGKLTFASPGSRYIALVVENRTNQPFFFFSSPHAIQPVEAGLGILFKCLCLGDVFYVKQKRAFARVMELQVLTVNRVTEATLTHDLIGMDASKFKETYQEQFD